MRLAIAGSRSLLGQALRRRAGEAGWQTLTLGRGPEADLAFDALSAADVAPLEACDALVICTAAFAGTTVEGARENVQVNVMGALALLDAAVRGGVGHVTFVSSTSAIGACDSYGMSKAFAEDLLARLCAVHGIGFATVRPAQIYDAEGLAAKHQPFLYFLVDRLAQGQDVTLHGRVDVARNYVHVDDVAEAIFQCVQGRLEGAFNAVHPQTVTVRELAEAIRDVFGVGGRIAFDAGKPDMAAIEIPQDGNLFERLALAPRPLRAGLQAIRDRRAEAA
jgi:UDP-glucose 4-epimerase